MADDSNRGGATATTVTGDPQKASPAEIEHYLKGMNYPAKKDDLISYAQNEGAPEDVIAVMQKLPDEEYESAASVASGVGKIE